MRNFISVVFLACAFLSGCITNGYGNFSSNSNVFDKRVANDAVKQLTVLYPPARTRFSLGHSTDDAFGASLISGLRKKGYAVSETHEGKAENTRIIATQKTVEIHLNYIVDHLEGNLYRITLVMGNQSITRAYTFQNNEVYPAGAWVRKE